VPRRLSSAAHRFLRFVTMIRPSEGSDVRKRSHFRPAVGFSSGVTVQ
jgi:hypothetical protein